jgi:hypothetical protein
MIALYHVYGKPYEMTPQQALIIIIRLFSLLTMARVVDGVLQRVPVFSEHPESLMQFTVMTAFVLYTAIIFYRHPLPLVKLVLRKNGMTGSQPTQFGEWFAIGRTLLGFWLLGECFLQLAIAMPALTNGASNPQTVSHFLSGVAKGICGVVLILGWPKGSAAPPND